MALETWDCPCGRRVPGRVETCRCGRARPAASTPLPPSIPLPPSSGEPTSLLQSTGLRAVGTLVAMVAIYFGGRACNREVASRDVRKQAQEALAGSIGAQNAETALNRYHRHCFDDTYRTGWGRRQASKFDDQKYVACLAARVRQDRDLARVAGPPSRPVEAVGAAPEPTARPTYPLQLLQPRLLGFDRLGGRYEMTVRVTGPVSLGSWFVERTLCDGTPVDAQARQAGPVQLGVYPSDRSLVPLASTASCSSRCRVCAVELRVASHEQAPVSDTIVVQRHDAGPEAVAKALAPKPARDRSGPLRIHDARLVKYDRRSGTIWIAYKFSGDPLPAHPRTALRGLCDGAPHGDGPYSMNEMAFDFEGDPSTISSITSAECAPHCRSCAAELALSDPSAVPLTNTLVLKLY
jgi:hypothetical protein